MEKGNQYIKLIMLFKLARTPETPMCVPASAVGTDVLYYVINFVIFGSWKIETVLRVIFLKVDLMV